MAKWTLITMEWWLLTFFFTAILSLFLPIVPEFSLLLVILLLALFLIFTNKFRLIAIAVFAFTWILMAGSQYHNSLNKNNIAVQQLHKKPHLIQGEVINIVNSKPGNHRFNLLVTHWQGLEVKQKFKIRLTWKEPKKTLMQGQKWQFLVKLKPAHGLANIGGFNYQVWLLQQQIVATGYVKPDTTPKALITAKSNNILLHSQITWRQYLYRELSVELDDKSLSGLILALGFGERGKLTQQHWQVLSATATQHLIAISGLHIGIVAFASLTFLRAVLRLLPLHWLLSTRWQLTLMQMNLRYLPIICSCLMAWYYAYLAGFSIPTLRALVMLLLFWSLKLMVVHMTLLRWLLLAIFVILLFWPLSIISASFWLSISALVIIFSTFSRFSMTAIKSTAIANGSALTIDDALAESLRSKQWRGIKERAIHWLKTLVVMQLALTLAMLPIAASLSYQLPLAAFFANIVAVPVMSVTVIPLTLLAVITLPFSDWLSGACVDLALLSLSLIWQWLSYLASAKWAFLAVSYQQIQVLLLFFVFIACTLFFRLSKGKLLACLALFVFAISTQFYRHYEPNEWQLSVLDVGHGLAVVIEKNGSVFLYDTGASYPSGFNMAEAAILPYLKHQGYRDIAGVMISHNDNDHAGGLQHLREKIAIDNVIANDVSLMPNSRCVSGQSFIWQGLSFEMLSPMQANGDKNDDSCVLTISDGWHRVLLPGDISVKQERRLLSLDGMRNKLASDLLIAPHHGSKSSSSRRFLQAVAPRYAVFSSGYLNQWNMPSAEILSRYRAENIETFNTADVGMVRFTFNKALIGANDTRDNKNHRSTNITVESYQDIRPYWFVN